MIEDITKLSIGYSSATNTGIMACTHGHRTDSACCRRTPSLYRLRTASVRLRTVSVRIGTVSITEIPLSKRSQYGLKRYANGLKRYANGASTASVYSRLSRPMPVRMGHFPCEMHVQCTAIYQTPFHKRLGIKSRLTTTVQLKLVQYFRLERKHVKSFYFLLLRFL